MPGPQLSPSTHLVLALCTAVAMLVGSTRASAAPVVDQAQLTFDIGIPWPDDIPNGQSFTVGLDGLLTQIDVFSNGPNAGGTATMTLYSGDGRAGTVLGTVMHIFGSTPGTQPISFDVSPLGVLVTTGEMYTFDITAFTGTQQILSNSTNPYAGGRQYDNPTFYGDQPSWDLMFQTFVVPEPGTGALLALGLGVLASRGAARKRSDRLS